MEVPVGEEEETLNSPPPPPLTTEKHVEPATSFRSSSTAAAPSLQDGKMLVKLRIGSLIVGDHPLQIGNGGGDEHGGGGVYGDGYVPVKIKDEYSISSSSPINNGQNNPSPNNGVRVCPECFKEFNSGKALGGHMRIHVQEAGRKKQLLKPQKTAVFKNLHQENPNPVQIMNGEIPTCYHCGKTFPSKKSLYGHMRCHPEREWRGVIPPRAAMEGGGGGGGGVRVGLMKTFKTSSSSASLSSSRESIDFDMQLQPTNSGNYDGAFDGDDDVDVDVDESREDEVDLVKSLPSWATKAKRGRKAVSKDEDDEVLRDIAQDLMLLAQGGAQSFAESGLTQRAAPRVDEDQLEGSNSNSMSKAENDDVGELKLGSTDVGAKGKVKGVAIMETAAILPTAAAAMDDGVDQGNLNNWSDNESDSRNTHDHQLLMLGLNKYDKLSTSPNTKLDHKMVKKRKKMKLMMDLDPNSARSMIGTTLAPPLKAPMLGNLAATTTSPDQPGKYRCSTCNKCFPSHQALGGHRSSHNKVKVPSATSHHENQEGDDEEDGSYVIHQLQGGEGEMVEKELLSVAAQQHECKICHKVFPTGQALGGHKRCHWTGGGQVAEQAPSSQVTSNSPGEASHTTGGVAAPAPRLLDFDLNEAPPMEDEAVVGYGYGYSSSHNSNMG